MKIEKLLPLVGKLLAFIPGLSITADSATYNTITHVVTVKKLNISLKKDVPKDS